MTPRILHVASGREWRGGERQVWLLARELARLGVSQQAITARDSELARRLASEGIAVPDTAWRLGVDPFAVLAVRRVLGRDRPDIVHAHDAHAVRVAGLAGACADGRLLIATRRTVFPLRRGGYWTQAARVVAISDAVRRMLVAGGVPAARIELVPSGIAREELARTPRGQLRARLGLPPRAPVAVSVAAFTGEKDHLTLLKAAALLATPSRLPTLHWALVGGGPEQPRIARALRELGLSDRVHFLGNIPDPAPLVADATCLVLATRAEGLGSALLEAMALSVPVAASAAGGPEELLADGAGLLVPVGDAPALADAVARIVTEPGLAAALTARGAAVAERHDVRGMAERTLSVYRSAMEVVLRA